MMGGASAKRLPAKGTAKKFTVGEMLKYMQIARQHGTEELERRIGSAAYRTYGEYLSKMSASGLEPGTLVYPFVAELGRALTAAAEPLRRLGQHLKLATAGERRAIRALLEWDPIGTLQVDEIARHIEKRSPPRSTEDREYLERMTDAVRKGLLAPKPGRPRLADAAAAGLAEQVQGAFETASANISIAYRNRDLRRQAIERLGAAIADKLPGNAREAVRVATIDVLEQHPGVRTTIGIRVAARVCRCSTRSIRSAIQALTSVKKQ
jgi:hypothetical protein